MRDGDGHVCFKWPGTDPSDGYLGIVQSFGKEETMSLKKQKSTVRQGNHSFASFEQGDAGTEITLCRQEIGDSSLSGSPWKKAGLIVCFLAVSAHLW